MDYPGRGRLLCFEELSRSVLRWWVGNGQDNLPVVSPPSPKKGRAEEQSTASDISRACVLALIFLVYNPRYVG